MRVMVLTSKELWFLLPKKKLWFLLSFNTTSPWSDWLLFLSLIGWLLLFLQTISFCSIFPISNIIWAASIFSDISMLIIYKYLSVALTFRLRSRIIYPITYWRAKFIDSECFARKQNGLLHYCSPSIHKEKQQQQ